MTYEQILDHLISLWMDCVISDRQHRRLVNKVNKRFGVNRLHRESA